MRQQTVLIIGGNGQLGQELTALLTAGEVEPWTVPARFESAKVIGLDIDDVDITDGPAVERIVQELTPDAVINCAAITQVDACETQPVAALRVNALGAANLARACVGSNAELLHVSTDYVFSGDGLSPYQEWDAPCPKTVYGKSKWLGEQYAQALCPRTYIVRTAWLYGRYGGNFVKTIAKLAREKGEAKVVRDQRGNPTYALDLAYHILKILDGGDYGIYHVTGNGECSWYEFASEIVRMAEIRATIQPCATEEFPRPAPRPAYSALDHLMLRATVGDEMRDWRAALEAFIKSGGLA